MQKKVSKRLHLILKRSNSALLPTNLSLIILILMFGAATVLVHSTTPLTISSVNALPAQTDSGQAVTLNGIWSGGTSPYTVTWYTGPLGTNCPQESANVLATYSGITLTSNSIITNPTTSNSYCLGVTDSESPAVTQLSLNYTTNSILSGFSTPQGVALSPSGTYAYVTNSGSSNIVIINTATNTVTSSITSGLKQPHGVSISPSGTYAYVTNYGANNVVIINTATNSVIGSITSGFDSPYRVIFSPSGTYAYVTNSGSSNVVIINTATNSVTNSIASGFLNPQGISFSPSGTYVYVTNFNSNNVAIINTATNSVIGSITSGFDSPSGVSISPSGTYAYVSNLNSNNVVIINTATNSVTSSITSGFSSPQEVAFSPSGTYAYVADSLANKITIINPGVGAETVNLIYSNQLTNPTLEAIHPITPSSPTTDSGIPTVLGLTLLYHKGTAPYTFKWYTGPSGNTCSEDSANLIATYSGITGTIANSVSVSPLTTNGYCAVVTDSGSPPETSDSPVSVVTVNPDMSATSMFPSNPTIDNGQPVTFTASWQGGTPTYGASLYSSSTSTCNQQSILVQQDIGLSTNSVTFSSVTPTTDTYYCVYVTDNTINSYAISGEITAGFNNIYAVSISPSGTYAYVTNYNSNNVVIINTATNTVTGSITSGFSNPEGVAFSPSGTYAYVTNYFSKNVVIINTATNSVNGSIISGFDNPLGVSFSPSGTYAYVSNFNSNNVVIINTATNSVTSSITSGLDQPHGVSISPSGAYAYVANYFSFNVVMINTTTNTVTKYVLGICTNHIMAFSPSGTFAYIPDCANSTVAMVDTATNSVAANINSTLFTNSPKPSGVAFSPSGKYAYIGNGANVTIVNIYTATVNSINSEVTVSPILSIPSISPSNPSIDSGQRIILTGSWSGGTPDYTATWYTGPSGNTCSQDGANILATYSGLSLTSNSISVSPTTTNSYCIGVTDSASTPVTELSSNDVVTVNNALTAGAILPSSPTINSGQSITLNANAIGGTTPYTYNWYTIAGTTSPTCTAANQITGQNSNTLQATPTATGTYAYQVTDSAPINSVACSSGDIVTVKSGIQVSNPYAGGSTGFFGHLPGTTTAATSSTTTTISTTSANTTVPATMPVIKQSTGVTTQLCNDTAGYYLVYNSVNATFNISPGIQSCISVTVKNVTSKYIQSNRSIITAINYSTNNTNVSSIIIIHYSCAIPYSDVYPSIFRNNTWQKINPFTLNVSACSVSFAIPSDPVIALINSAHANSTTVKTTTSANTTLLQTTASASNSNQQNQDIIWAVITVIIVIIILFVYSRSRKR